jgi:hypothetical protein
VKRRVFLLGCSGYASLAAADGKFSFREVAGGRLELLENGSPVFVYNYGMQLEPGIPEDRRRSSYLHPVYSPAGTVITADFPADHYHHRGVFWAWPVVRTSAGDADLWTLNGVETRFERWVARQAGTANAELHVENGWYSGGRRIVREEVKLVAYPAASGAREIAVSIGLHALGEPVTIGGARDQGKGYGGLSCRFAPRENTVIRTSDGQIAGDEDHRAHGWAEMEASFADRRACLRITANPANPGYPNEWCLRQYGFLGASFPGAALFRLEPGTPLKLRYQIRVHD